MEIHLTRNVIETTPMQVISIILKAVNNIDVQRDYLQIFKLEKQDSFTVLYHEQEVPEFKQMIYISEVTIENNMKLYLIFEADYGVLMISEEY